MEITEVRIKLVENASERLRAFCSITLDGDFVVRDLKIIDGTNGAFVAMPSRKLMDRCSRCGSKNHLRSRFCNDCGGRLNENRAPKDTYGRAKLHADVAHPINAACRERVQKAVVEAYHEEQERAKSPDYKPARYDDYDDIDDEPANVSAPAARSTPPPPPPKQPREEEPSPVTSSKSGDQFDDYNELIADLKRDAQSRQQERRDQNMRMSSFSDSDEPDEDIPSAPPAPQREESFQRDAVPQRDERPQRDEAPQRDEGFQRDDSARSAPSEPAASQPPSTPPPSDDDFGAGL